MVLQFFLYKKSLIAKLDLPLLKFVLIKTIFHLVRLLTFSFCSKVSSFFIYLWFNQ